MPGRFIGENVALLRDLVDFASVSGTPIAVLSLDQEKAFDRVDWSFMRATLSAMGFGPSFISWVDLFYHRVQSSVDVNGYLSPFISLSRGVRQGCPLSPLLYVLVSEVLAVNIRSNPRIPGLCLPDSTVLSPISQYADDTSLICTSDDSIKAVFETYALFEKASGAKLNQSKSKGLWLGSWSGRSDPPVPLDWTSVKIKVLGVFIGVGNLEEANWRPRIDAVDHVLKSWRSRVLSFRGKALVINPLALSRVWYVASLIHMPAWVLKELSFLAFSFFWSGKRELVSRSSVSLSPLFGGFSVVNVKFKVWSLLGQWVKRFASSSAGWISFLTYWFSYHFSASPLEVFPVLLLLIPGSCLRSIHPFCWLGAVLMVLFRLLAIRWFMVLFHVMLVRRFVICLPKFAIYICSLRIWPLHIVLGSLLRFMVIFIGPPLGNLCVFSTLIIRLSTLIGRSPMAFFILLSVLFLLVCLFHCPAFVVRH